METLTDDVGREPDQGAELILYVGPIKLNLYSKQVIAERQKVPLTPKEYSILELLALRKGVVLTREVFMEHLYNGINEPEMTIIDVFICKLRKKLAQAGVDNLIGTVWCDGYILREPKEDISPAA